MTPTISSLLSRVRAASGPDDGLDIDIGIALAGWRRGKVTLDPFSFTEDPDGDIIYGDAVALVERVLPGCHRWYTLTLVIDDDKATFYINNRENGPDIEPFFVSEDRIGEASKPLAILAALLSALEQKESADD